MQRTYTGEAYLLMIYISSYDIYIYIYISCNVHIPEEDIFGKQRYSMLLLPHPFHLLQPSTSFEGSNFCPSSQIFLPAAQFYSLHLCPFVHFSWTKISSFASRYTLF